LLLAQAVLALPRLQREVLKAAFRHSTELLLLAVAVLEATELNLLALMVAARVAVAAQVPRFSILAVLVLLGKVSVVDFPQTQPNGAAVVVVALLQSEVTAAGHQAALVVLGLLPQLPDHPSLMQAVAAVDQTHLAVLEALAVAVLVLHLIVEQPTALQVLPIRAVAVAVTLMQERPARAARALSSSDTSQTRGLDSWHISQRLRTASSLRSSLSETTTSSTQTATSPKPQVKRSSGLLGLTATGGRRVTTATR
jgi:hypothetical protein